MHTKSLQRLTMGGLILMDWGDRVTDPLTLPLAGVAQSSQTVGGQWARTLGRGNTSRTLTFSVEKAFTDIYARLGFEIEMDNVYQLGVRKALIIEVENGSTHQIDDFVLTSVTSSERGMYPERLILSFKGQAGQSRMTDRGGIGGLGWEDINTNWEDIQIPWQDAVTA